MPTELTPNEKLEVRTIQLQAEKFKNTQLQIELELIKLQIKINNKIESLTKSHEAVGFKLAEDFGWIEEEKKDGISFTSRAS